MDNLNNTTNYFYSSYCQYRLPCGYCKELGRDCPKNFDSGVIYTTISNNINSEGEINDKN